MTPAETNMRWRPTAADVLFVILALMVFRGARHSLLDDPGLGWHLRNIDAILAKGGWLTEDPFSDPRGGAPPRWYSNQWLGELHLWLGWKWAGLEGVAMANALVVAGMAGLLYRMLLADGLVWPVAMTWTVLGAMGTSCSWNARPNVLSILFLLVTARACVRLHEGALSKLGKAGLVALFALWANAHGGFVAGLVTLVATAGIEFGSFVGASAPESRAAARKRLVAASLLCLAAFLATLINPYGVDLYRWVFQLLGDPYFMDLHQEWRSPDFHSGGAIRYELLILLFPAMLALGRRRPHLVELGLSVLWLHFALTGFRYVALWVVVAVPLMARSSVSIVYLHDLANRLTLSSAPGSLFHTPTGRVPWRWSLLAGLLLLGGAKALEGRFAVHKQEIIATNAIDHLIDYADAWQQRHGRRPVLVHAYDWGGYLTWKGWPGLLNWIDDRNEVQRKERIQDYFDLMKAQPGWEDKLHAVDFVCIEPGTPLAKELAKSRGWTERYRDGYAVIFERRER